jgi:hypothetical protein
MIERLNTDHHSDHHHLIQIEAKQMEKGRTQAESTMTEGRAAGQTRRPEI